jgi:glutamine synthetase
LAKVPSTPGSLAEALKSLETDHDYLTTGGVFTEDFIENWISYKLDREVIPMSIRPHPYEFMLYYDC